VSSLSFSVPSQTDSPENALEGTDEDSQDEADTLQCVLGLLSAFLTAFPRQQDPRISLPAETRSLLSKLRDPLLYLSLHLADSALNSLASDCVYCMIHVISTTHENEVFVGDNTASEKSVNDMIREVSTVEYLMGEDAAMRAFGLSRLMTYINSVEVRTISLF
jgi:hypothetical protein